MILLLSGGSHVASCTPFMVPSPGPPLIDHAVGSDQDKCPPHHSRRFLVAFDEVPGHCRHTGSARFFVVRRSGGRGEPRRVRSTGAWTISFTVARELCFHRQPGPSGRAALPCACTRREESGRMGHPCCQSVESGRQSHASRYVHGTDLLRDMGCPADCRPDDEAGVVQFAV